MQDDKVKEIRTKTLNLFGDLVKNLPEFRDRDGHGSSLPDCLLWYVKVHIDNAKHGGSLDGGMMTAIEKFAKKLEQQGGEPALLLRYLRQFRRLVILEDHRQSGNKNLFF
ncbi:hypothetical protein AGMMS49949_07350 [Alphaproteobacteria bacterium]|nr:hypothetical protein AGMMS49949_07350 [Alphaproteobacteria bacterium]